MFCVKCGNKLEEEVDRCPLCNEKVSDETVTSEDVKDFVAEYSAKLKEKSEKLVDVAQEKAKQIKEEREVMKEEMAREKRARREVLLEERPQYIQEDKPKYIQNKAQVIAQGQERMGVLRCPRCQNENLQIITESSTTGKDFSAGKGCCGVILLGPIGILCGACGKGKQMNSTTYWICPVCGNKFKA